MRLIIRLFSIFALAIILISCKPLPYRFSKSGGAPAAIRNAISDFAIGNSKHDSVFSVVFYDSVYTMKLVKKNTGDLIWERNIFYPAVVAVNIFPTSRPLVLNEGDLNNKARFPNRFLVVKGKLYYWFDPQASIDSEIITQFRKYRILRESAHSTDDLSHDETRKGASYFFCRNDFGTFKKVISDKPIGFYEVPKVGCGIAQLTVNGR